MSIMFAARNSSVYDSRPTGGARRSPGAHAAAGMGGAYPYPCMNSEPPTSRAPCVHHSRNEQPPQHVPRGL